MDLMEIKLRNSGGNLTGTIMGLLIVLGIFFGCYLYFAENIESSGIVMNDSKYLGAYENLTSAQENLSLNINEIKTNLDNIKETESIVFQAWNGLKGLGNTLKLPISFLNVILTAWQATVPTLDILPSWATALIFIGLVAFMVFLVLRILKGEPAVG